MSQSPVIKSQEYLRELCLAIDSRRVGSPGNHAATDFFARHMAAYGFAVETPEFDCIDWSVEGVQLTAADQTFEAFASPYSRGCRASAPLVVIATVEELAAADITARIVLLRGEIAKEPLMPKNFPFYNPDEHRRIIHLLETGRPQAIIAATTRNPDMAGALYPFPLFEDGDFDIPSVYLTEDEGARLARHTSEPVSLHIDARRIPAQGRNVIARKGRFAGRRVVLFAHIDAKTGTPGALDNAAGVVTLLLLAELLADYNGDLGIEIVAMNGEDYYSNPGEQLYLAQNAGRFEDIALGINLDGVGYVEGNLAYSLYECPPEMVDLVQTVFAAYPGLVPGEPWFQGDHFLFLMHGRPTLAITSERAFELLNTVIHTTSDTPELVDPHKLVTLARALKDLLPRLG